MSTQQQDPSVNDTAYPLQQVATARGLVQYRAAGAAPRATHVLLHGIGSASASWQAQLQAAQGRADLRVLAWDAPGYGRSEALAAARPLAADYAQALWQWLDALQETGPLTLVGHSLGALMVTAAALQQPMRVQRLVLLSPARGYGNAPAAEREEKLASRLANLQQLGPQGMADARAAAMLSPQATPAMVEAVRQTMAQIIPAGYTQAAHMLAMGQLDADLQALQMPITVASGSADTITPPGPCAEVAQRRGLQWTDLGPVGHACPVEAPARVNLLLGLQV